MIVKIFRNGLGAIIAGISTLTMPKKIIRNIEQQKNIDKETKNLELYQFFGCPFCIKVRRVIYKLNLNIAVKDAQNKQKYRDELLTNGGEIKVPCLKIIGTKDVWMYESSDIIKYLEENFGNGR